MYLTKEKSKTSIYKKYEPNFPRHKDVELQAFVAYTVGNDMSGKMKSAIRCMTKMIVRGFSKGAN